MQKKKVGLPKGTRDFGPLEMRKRNHILEIIKNTYKKYGFDQIETPSMENLDVLTGKYGDEGDQLLYKILDSGNFLSNVNQEDIKDGYKPLTSKIASKGLRYDLTVPFARYVANNINELALPFKRFQVQPVWRADRPQKGRYREFYQCDADIVGSDSLIYEAEIILIIKDVLSQLKINDYSIKLNNRKILSSFAAAIKVTDKETDLFVAIDKLDKIGIDKVVEELEVKRFTKEQQLAVKELLSKKGNTSDLLDYIEKYFTAQSASLEGVEELKELFSLLKTYDYTDSNLELDFTLARGLSYYTGTILEIKVNNASIGSISGGGRYDNLTERMGVDNVSGIGFSFGIDRIYDVMTELNLFANFESTNTKILITHFDKESLTYGCKIAQTCRENNIACEIYPDIVKIKKQFQYANKKGIPYVITIGSDEMASGELTLKNMLSGEQKKGTLTQLIEEYKKD
ncbi:MAG: histidine--tRNA ligase [Cyclobacteriaceae bacterium]